EALKAMVGGKMRELCRRRRAIVVAESASQPASLPPVQGSSRALWLQERRWAANSVSGRGGVSRLKKDHLAGGASRLVGRRRQKAASLLFRLHRHPPAIVATKIDDGILFRAADNSGARDAAARANNRSRRGTLRHKSLSFT